VPTSSTAFEIVAASALASQATAAATSSGSFTRPATLRWPAARILSSLRWSVIRVRVKPGTTTLTRTPSGESAAASDRAIATTAPLVAPYSGFS
jgi:hypothetical protein